MPAAVRAPRRGRRRTPTRVRARRIALLAAVLTLVPALVSFVSSMAQPSNTSFGIRSVEWLRSHGAGGLVSDVESYYYSLNAPSTGGPALRALPRQAGATAVAGRVAVASSGRGAVASSGRARAVAYRPPPIAPVIAPALPGEGVWRATFAGAGPRPPVLITSFRPDPSYPSLVAGVAWISHARTSVWLYPGRDEPAVTMPSRGPEEVPLAWRAKLVATFNSAFKLADSGGGFVYGGHTYAPLRHGLATILRRRDGSVDVVSWGGGPDAGADVVYARQNLALIVDHGRPGAHLQAGPQWGVTLGNAIRVWRSAVGVDRHGNLIYAAADYQTVASLAQIMVRAGAVRAMELDINSYWPSFITYRFPGARDPANLLTTMTRSPDRYLTPDDRDFFAVYVRPETSGRSH